jgi:hypothetical protein
VEHERPSGPLGPAELLALQAGVGNHAVTRLLARQGAQAPVRQKQRDVRTMSDAEIDRELQTLMQQHRELHPSDPRSQARWKRWEDLGAEQERRAREAEGRAEAAAARDRVNALAEEATQVGRKLDDELSFAIETLEDVADRLNSHFGFYNQGYDNFAAVLAKAKRDVAARNERNQAIGSILVGTGLGLTAGAIFFAARGAYTIVVEAATEATELIAGKGFTQGSGDAFTPPASLDPKLRALAEGNRLMDAWRGLAKFNLTTRAFGQYQLAVQKLAFDLERRPTDELVKDADRLLARPHLANFRRSLNDLHQSVAEFSAAARHPDMYKSPVEIEEDLWVRWIAALPPDVWALHDALDENAIEDHLHKIGVLGGAKSRLGVDFGSATSVYDTAQAYESAVVEGKRLDQLGRYGVAVDPIGPRSGGTIWINSDVYVKLGKKPPEQLGTGGSFQAVLWNDDKPVKVGDFVRVRGTSNKGVEVEPVRP